MVVPWLVFPLVLAGLCLGCGLLVARLTPFELPAPLLLPVGFATIAVVAQIALFAEQTASLATPAVAAVAALGFMTVSRARLRSAADPSLVVAAATYLVYAAPVLASGRATFLGYIKLDDTATYFATLDRALGHGYSLAGLAPSTYEATVNATLGNAYPLGSLLPLGIGHEILRTDVAWLWQPYLSLLGALAALSLYALARTLLRSRVLCMVAAFGGAQAALLYGYAMWGGIKELATSVLVIAAAALVVPTARSRPTAVLALALTTAAVIDVLSAGGGVWLVPVAVGFAAVAFGRGVVPAVAAGAALLGAAAVAAAPALVAAFTWLPRASGSLTSSYGNLLHRLDWLQAGGVWLTGDFRNAPADRAPTDVLLVVVALGLVAAAVYAFVVRAWAIYVALGCAAFACAVYVERAGPWLGGKALASSSPILLGTALIGAGALIEHRRRTEGVLVAAFLLVGVVWSNSLQYRDVFVAPSDRLAEFERIGHRFAGAGPTLLTQFDSYGARHFLRNLTTEAASELRRNYIYLRNGQVAATGVSPDIDEIRLDQILHYRLLVLPRDGSESRPPSVYRLVWRGRWYDVWEKGEGDVIEHLSLGDRLQPSAPAPCTDVRRLAREAASGGGRLAYVARPQAIVFQGDGADTTASESPQSRYGQNPHSIFPTGPTTVTKSFAVPASGSYRIWVGGSYTTRITVAVDGRIVGRSQNQLNWPGNFVEVGRAELTSGTHTFELRYGSADWRPGSHAPPPFGLGPFVIAPTTEELPVSYAPPGRAQALCGRPLDWVEVVR